MYIEFAKARIYPAAILFTSFIGTFMSPVYAAEKPHSQEFVVTAYYSPLPDQCCYFRGSYAEEVMFNGEGKAGADGTAVYPGMIAAPGLYPFGTVIELPGLGVGTVHDRGARIIEWGEDIHRIDLWMGTGEEGLARALAWGVRHVKGTVYPLDSGAAPAEHFSLAALPADTKALAALPKKDVFTILAKAKYGDATYAARVLQSTLKDTGYFDTAITGQFGPVTQAALRQFAADYGLKGDGTTVDDVTAATLLTAAAIRTSNLPDVSIGLAKGSTGNDVRQIQKLMRYLGYYRGRTDGVFSDALKAAVVAFQIQSSVIPQVLATGAGRVGPATQTAILKAWKVKQVAEKSRTTLTKMQVKAKIQTTLVPSRVLARGDRGTSVKLLQRLLRESGYLKDTDVTGLYGDRTERAIIAYQQDRKIISSAKDHGAGVFGPATRQMLLSDAVNAQLKKIRYEGV